MRFRVLMAAAIVSLLLATKTNSQEPGWYGRVVLYGTERQIKEQTHILYRPYRPFHFYGNTVRRVHYRGTPIPTVRDMRDGVTALLLQR